MKSIIYIIRAWVVVITFCLYSTIGSSQQVIEDAGHGIQIGLPISALTLSILKKDKKGSIQLLKSLVLETIAVHGLKRGINRTRPNGRNYSFPSGHTAVSFMSATYIWKRYGWQLGVPAGVLASFVGYSRAGIDEPVHYYSDVFAGAAIGIASSLLFTKKYKSDLNIEVIGDTSFVGIKLNYILK